MKAMRNIILHLIEFGNFNSQKLLTVPWGANVNRETSTLFGYRICTYLYARQIQFAWQLVFNMRTPCHCISIQWVHPKWHRCESFWLPTGIRQLNECQTPLTSNKHTYSHTYTFTHRWSQRVIWCPEMCSQKTILKYMNTDTDTDGDVNVAGGSTVCVCVCVCNFSWISVHQGW